MASIHEGELRHYLEERKNLFDAERLSELCVKEFAECLPWVRAISRDTRMVSELSVKMQLKLYLLICCLDEISMVVFPKGYHRSLSPELISQLCQCSELWVVNLVYIAELSDAEHEAQQTSQLLYAGYNGAHLFTSTQITETQDGRVPTDQDFVVDDIAF